MICGGVFSRAAMRLTIFGATFCLAGISVTNCAASPDTNNPASNSVAYTIKNLGTLGGKSSSASAINASGQVVGQVAIATGEMHAFLWNGEKMTDLGTLPGCNVSTARAINDAGLIVGCAETDFLNPRAFVYSGGKMRELGTLGGSNSTAYAINSSGDIVGQADTAGGERHAFLFADGRMQDLGVLGGKGSGAHGMNDKRQIVGESSIDKPNSMIVTVPFLHSGGKMIALDYAGHQTSRATAINSSGEIVGAIGDVTAWSSDHAFLYRDGKLQDIGTLGGNAPFSEARAINSRGQIVGLSGSHPLDNKSLEGSRAFLYSDGRMRDLRELVGETNLARAGFMALATANGINDRGHIVGAGIDSNRNWVAYLLTPIK